MFLFQCGGLAYSTERDELPARLRADVGVEEGGHGQRVLHGHLQEQIHLQPAHPRSGREPIHCAHTVILSLCIHFLISDTLISKDKPMTPSDTTLLSTAIAASI